jgi:hypothetical protein
MVDLNVFADTPFPIPYLLAVEVNERDGRLPECHSITLDTMRCGAARDTAKR